MKLSSPKKLLPECTITRYFKTEIWTIFWGGAQPVPRPLPTKEGETPPQTPPHPLCASIVAPSALHTSRFRRSVLCVPYFQCRLLTTLTVTNVVQGKRSQWWKFTGPPNQKSWLRQWSDAGKCLVHFARLANTLLKDEESAQDNHVLACNFAKYLHRF